MFVLSYFGLLEFNVSSYTSNNFEKPEDKHLSIHEVMEHQDGKITIPTHTEEEEEAEKNEGANEEGASLLAPTPAGRTPLVRSGSLSPEQQLARFGNLRQSSSLHVRMQRNQALQQKRDQVVESRRAQLGLVKQSASRNVSKASVVSSPTPPLPLQVSTAFSSSSLLSFSSSSDDD